MMKTVWMADGQAPLHAVAVDVGGGGTGVGVAAHPAVVHASQQLCQAPMQAVPPGGATHRLASRWIR